LVTPESFNIYKTSDTAIAAYLCISNFELLRIDEDDNHQSIFIFKATDGIEQAAKSFEIGTAICNVSAFFRQYKKLLREIKQ